MTNVCKVTAQRWEHGWELHVDGVGVTQCGPLADAERMVRDYLATELGGEPADYDVEVHYDLGGLETDVAGARRRMAEAQSAVDAAAAEMRTVVRRLRADGVSVRDTATILKVSPGRISQLSGGRPKKAAAAKSGKGARRVA